MERDKILVIRLNKLLSQAGKCLKVLSESNGNICSIKPKKSSENYYNFPTVFLNIDE